MTLDFSRPGILPCQSIETLIAAGAVTSATPFDADQVQPASLDLRLGARAWRVRASFLPGGRRVQERIDDVAMHTIDLEGGAVLEKGCVYIAELQERLKLPPGLLARANPKSSSGRVDVFVRLLTDRGLASGAAVMRASWIWTGRMATIPATSGSRWKHGAGTAGRANCCWTPASSIFSLPWSPWRFRSIRLRR